MISVTRLRVLYGRTIALNSLDLELEAGIVGVFGPNGSGKSTLLRVLAGLLRPDEGDVLLHGRPLSARDEGVRRLIGYAGHEAGLYARLTVYENLRLFGSLYGAGDERVLETIGAFDLEDWRDVPAGALSAGLLRRAAVGRALLHDPLVLLLDEPYANLDDDAAGLVSDAIVRWRRPDRIALVASHGAKKVKAYADAGLILKRGEIALYGRYGRRAAAGTTR